jgi:DNA-directed RNA polymerase subunit RPC12/RpoP
MQMKIQVKCSNCKYMGPITLQNKHFDNWRTASEGIPCPNCGFHRLTRVYDCLREKQ